MSTRVLTGMGSLVNPDNIRSDVDLAELERRMIDGGIHVPAEAPEDTYQDELRDAARRMGITFDDVSAKSSAATRSETPVTTPMRSAMRADTYAPATPQREEVSPFARGVYTESTSTPSRAAPAPVDEPEPEMYGVSSLRAETMEQERRSHIASVVGSDDGSFSLDDERREDMKCAMLAEIDSLISSLSMEEVDLKRLPTADANSTFSEVDHTLKVLRHKNDQIRCCSFAEEGLMFLAYTLEDFCDGKQVWFNRWRPDMTGYHNHMNAKLRRIRHDTGQVVSSVISANGISPGWRMVMELVPNMVLYSKFRKQHNEDQGQFIKDEDVQAVKDL